MTTKKQDTPRWTRPDGNDAPVIERIGNGPASFRQLTNPGTELPERPQMKALHVASASLKTTTLDEDDLPTAQELERGRKTIDEAYDVAREGIDGLPEGIEERVEETREEFIDTI